MGMPTSEHDWMTVITTLAALATIVWLMFQLRRQPGAKARRVDRRD